MSIAPALDTRPGRPRDVTGKSWFVDHPDGRVSYVIIRRAESGSPNGMTLAFEGADDADALARYERYIDQQSERVTRNAERRARWGPEGKGKMA